MFSDHTSRENAIYIQISHNKVFRSTIYYTDEKISNHHCYCNNHIFPFNSIIFGPSVPLIKDVPLKYKLIKLKHKSVTKSFVNRGEGIMVFSH